MLFDWVRYSILVSSHVGIERIPPPLLTPIDLVDASALKTSACATSDRWLWRNPRSPRRSGAEAASQRFTRPRASSVTSLPWPHAPDCAIRHHLRSVRRADIPGDRYLLCSDGLSAVVDRSALHVALSVPAEPEQAAGKLIDLAYANGAPDNIACVVADA